MAISLNQGTGQISTPVVKRQKIGDTFTGAIIRWEQRKMMKKNPATGELEPVMKPGTNKARQELVVHCLAVSGTAVAGIGDEVGVPEPGAEVRLILRSGAFADWISARKEHRSGDLMVGDLVSQVTTHAQAYDQSGAKLGGEIKTQAEADAVPRTRSIGFYGTTTLSVNSDAALVTKCEEAYMKHKAIKLDDTVASDEDVSEESLLGG